MEQQKTMKCIVIKEPRKYQLQIKQIPKPSSGQVLIKVMASPINPSDLVFLKGQYQSGKKMPCVPGFQGCGLVVQSGGGLLGWNIKNKKVAFVVEKQQIGTYSQFVVVDAANCVPLDESTSFQQGSMSLINPLTALAFIDKLKAGKHKSVIHTAACSQLGRMMNRIFIKQGIQIINIVRRNEQIEILKKQQNAKYVLNSQDLNFKEDLKALCQKLGTKICFEGIGGGKIVGTILSCMPPFSTIQVYGGLSYQEITGIYAKDLVYHNKSIKGFHLDEWIKSKSLLSLFPIFMKIKNLVKEDLKSKVSHQFPLEKFEEGVNYYISNMTKGKVLIKPWMDQSQYKELEQKISEKMKQQKQKKNDQKQEKIQKEQSKQQNSNN